MHRYSEMAAAWCAESWLSHKLGVRSTVSLEGKELARDLTHDRRQHVTAVCVLSIDEHQCCPFC